MAPRSASTAVAPCTLLHAKVLTRLGYALVAAADHGRPWLVQARGADVDYDKRRRLKSVLASVSVENELLAGGSAGTSKSHLVKCAAA